jgi:PAS domain S-box-containing protein
MQHQLTQREKELERLHGIVATIKDGIVMLDLDGNIKDINQAARHILGHN